ncbi:RNA polymerase sigma factor, RpoD/SigA family, partial [Pseudomonas sp. HMWF031]
MSLTGIAKTLKMSRDRTRRLEREGLESLRQAPLELRDYTVAA